MTIDTSVLKQDEKAIFRMRSIFEKSGYSRYTMSKFEQYDYYVRNKDFLISDNIITFTDTDGKFMALKPDVTLSIIKNTPDTPDYVQKLYYNENVYRVPKGASSFKEIMQVGLECIGNIDDFATFEVLLLAAKSLESISENFVLDISHLGIISAELDSLPLTSVAKSAIIKCIGEKNIHELVKICKDEGVDSDNLVKLVSTYGEPEKVLPVLSDIKNDNNKNAIESLTNVVNTLSKCGFDGKIRIDFSVINDMNYYSGIVFKGFIDGIASGVLSGGQYDKLMKKMGKKSSALGFAVYLDLLERLSDDAKEFDVDTLLLYDDTANICEINKTVSSFNSKGKSVVVQKSVPDKLKYRQIVKITNKGVQEL